DGGAAGCTVGAAPKQAAGLHYAGDDLPGDLYAQFLGRAAAALHCGHEIRPGSSCIDSDGSSKNVAACVYAGVCYGGEICPAGPCRHSGGAAPRLCFWSPGTGLVLAAGSLVPRVSKCHFATDYDVGAVSGIPAGGHGGGGGYLFLPCLGKPGHFSDYFYGLSA